MEVVYSIKTILGFLILLSKVSFLTVEFQIFFLRNYEVFPSEVSSSIETFYARCANLWREHKKHDVTKITFSALIFLAESRQLEQLLCTTTL